MAERLDLDGRAVRTMERLHRAYGGRSVLVRNPIRLQAVLLDADDVRVVLAGTRVPFSPASDEERAVLSHFGPERWLISRGADQAPRRELKRAGAGNTVSRLQPRRGLQGDRGREDRRRAGERRKRRTHARRPACAAQGLC